MNLDIKNKINLSLIVSSLIIILFIVFFIYPLFKEIKESFQTLSSQKNIFINLEQKTKNIKEFQSYYKDHKSNIEKIDLLFINSEEPVNFIKFLEVEAQNSQLSLQIYPEILTKQENEPWSFLAFRLTLNGSFLNFMEFLEKLESADYLIKIQTLNLKRLEINDSKDITATLLIKAYTKNPTN